MGCVDIFHSRRTNYQECEYWIREEGNRVTLNEWTMKNIPSGTFWCKEVSPKFNEANNIGGFFLSDRNIITLESDDDINAISRGCIVKYNGELWMVDRVQREVHRKESEFNAELDYKYTLTLRK